MGEIPAINLLRIRGRPCVRFAGKFWRVRRISHDGIHVEPSKPVPDVIEFIYGGSAAPYDPDMVDRIWRLIHEPDISADIFSKDLGQRVSSFTAKTRAFCSQDQIPYVRSPEGIRYFTFAGYMVNRAVGLFSKKPDFKAEELSLLVPSPIDWSAIPRLPADYEGIFHLLFEASSDQSLYQKQLPLGLQEREFLQGWFNDPSILRTLNRLSGSEAIEVADFPGL